VISHRIFTVGGFGGPSFARQHFQLEIIDIIFKEFFRGRLAFPFRFGHAIQATKLITKAGTVTVFNHRRALCIKANLIVAIKLGGTSPGPVLRTASGFPANSEHMRLCLKVDHQTICFPCPHAARKVRQACQAGSHVLFVASLDDSRLIGIKGVVSLPPERLARRKAFQNFANLKQK
jgi:hypothetical protein